MCKWVFDVNFWCIVYLTLHKVENLTLNKIRCSAFSVITVCDPTYYIGSSQHKKWMLRIGSNRFDLDFFVKCVVRDFFGTKRTGNNRIPSRTHFHSIGSSFKRLFSSLFVPVFFFQLWVGGSDLPTKRMRKNHSQLKGQQQVKNGQTSHLSKRKLF